MRTMLAHADHLLRGTDIFDAAAPLRRAWWVLPAMILVFSPVYGAFMGSYHLDSAQRLWMVLFSAVKMPLLLLTTSVLCLPAFFVLNTLLGLRDDFREALQAILAGQAGMSIALASLAPLTRFFYFSTLDYQGAHLFNAAMFSVAVIAAQIVMFRYYRVLIRRHRYHRPMLYTWLALYAFVGIQMGWTLRPFIGSPALEPTFFRAQPFSNAYVVVFHLFVDFL